MLIFYEELSMPKRR